MDKQTCQAVVVVVVDGLIGLSEMRGLRSAVLGGQLTEVAVVVVVYRTTDKLLLLETGG